MTPWPGNFHVPWAQPKKKKKEERKKRRRKKEEKERRKEGVREGRKSGMFPAKA